MNKSIIHPTNQNQPLAMCYNNVNHSFKEWLAKCKSFKKILILTQWYQLLKIMLNGRFFKMLSGTSRCGCRLQQRLAQCFCMSQCLFLRIIFKENRMVFKPSAVDIFQYVHWALQSIKIYLVWAQTYNHIAHSEIPWTLWRRNSTQCTKIFLKIFSVLTFSRLERSSICIWC